MNKKSWSCSGEKWCSCHSTSLVYSAYFNRLNITLFSIGIGLRLEGCSFGLGLFHGVVLGPLGLVNIAAKLLFNSARTYLSSSTQRRCAVAVGDLRVSSSVEEDPRDVDVAGLGCRVEGSVA